MDPIAFPVLAGALLNEAIRFLFNRANAVLDRRAGRMPVEEPEQIAGQPHPLLVHAEALADDDRIERVAQARDVLEQYLADPDRAREGDEDLRQVLAALKRDLEAIYGQEFVFAEQRPGPTVDVSQNVDSIADTVTGVKATRVGGQAKVHVDQKSTRVESGGSMTGADLGSIG
ncbi:hypothetical protein ACIP5Y_12745 [Nocardia sp. NPDC088792]|uniref:hypothetical protein n=1 Tax=Nocardia sp. NPDC088792 TaxID=3364332 RepID=UPI0037F98325